MKKFCAWLMTMTCSIAALHGTESLSSSTLTALSVISAGVAGYATLKAVHAASSSHRPQRSYDRQAFKRLESGSWTLIAATSGLISWITGYLGHEQALQRTRTSQ